MSVKKRQRATTILASTYQKFWQGFNEKTSKDDVFRKEFRPHPYGSARCYQDYPIGKPYHIVAHVFFAKHEIHIGAYFGNLDAYHYCSEVLKNRIEHQIGKPLAWKQHKTKASAYLFDSVDFDENHGWDETYEVIIANMLLMKKAFEH